MNLPQPDSSPDSNINSPYCTVPTCSTKRIFSKITLVYFSLDLESSLVYCIYFRTYTKDDWKSNENSGQHFYKSRLLLWVFFRIQCRIVKVINILAFSLKLAKPSENLIRAEI
jgi:hypothetical protein